MQGKITRCFDERRLDLFAIATGTITFSTSTIPLTKQSPRPVSGSLFELGCPRVGRKR